MRGEGKHGRTVEPINNPSLHTPPSEVSVGHGKQTRRAQAWLKDIQLNAFTRLNKAVK